MDELASQGIPVQTDIQVSPDFQMSPEQQTPAETVDDILHILAEDTNLAAMCQRQQLQLPRRLLSRREKVDQIFATLTNHYQHQAKLKDEQTGLSVVQTTFRALNLINRTKTEAVKLIEKAIPRANNLIAKIGEFWSRFIEDEGLDGLGGMLGVWTLKFQTGWEIASGTQQGLESQPDTITVGKTACCLIKTIYTTYQENQNKIRAGYSSDKKFARRKARSSAQRRAEKKAGTPDMGFFSGMDENGQETGFQPRQENPTIRLFLGDGIHFVDIYLSELNANSNQIGHLLTLKQLDLTTINSRFQQHIARIDDPDRGLIIQHPDGRSSLKLDKNPPLITVVMRTSDPIKPGRLPADNQSFLATGQLASLVLGEQYDNARQQTMLKIVEVNYHHAGLDGGPGGTLTKTMPADLDALADKEKWIRIPNADLLLPQPTAPDIFGVARSATPITSLELNHHSRATPLAPGLETYREAMEIAGMFDVKINWEIKGRAADLINTARETLNDSMPKNADLVYSYLFIHMNRLISELEPFERSRNPLHKKERARLDRLRRIKTNWSGEAKEEIDALLQKQLEPYCPQVFLTCLGFSLACGQIQVCVQPEDPLIRLSLAGLSSAPEMSSAGLQEFIRLIKTLTDSQNYFQGDEITDSETFLTSLVQAFGLENRQDLQNKLEQNLINWTRYFSGELKNARDGESIAQYLALLSGSGQTILTALGLQLAPTITEGVAGGHGQLSDLNLEAEPRIYEFISAVSERQEVAFSSLRGRGFNLRRPVNNRLVRKIIISGQLALTSGAEQNLKTNLEKIKVQGLPAIKAEKKIQAVLQKWQKENPGALTALTPKVKQAIVAHAAQEVQSIYQSTILFSFLAIASLGKLGDNELGKHYQSMVELYKLPLVNQMVARAKAIEHALTQLQENDTD
ncbi:hypothetical protein KKD62_02865 [Patescibacteria group bacterium]|nr:hypothetical protein [Patescibacteria group bacterium]MBU1931812.1 hypothetical protein [Patescibacteria group bacterium]